MALRWALAGGFVWWYNTTDVFADAPTYAHIIPTTEYEDEQLQTVESISVDKRKREVLKEATVADKSKTIAVQGGEFGAEAGPVEQLEDEADQQGAFNEETGEINWDCPCLGGMAHGPCGEEFKTAFSCFVYSKEDPKGIDCIENFKTMQGCFRNYPEIYGSEMDEEDEEHSEQGAAALASQKEEKTDADESPSTSQTNLGDTGKPDSASLSSQGTASPRKQDSANRTPAQEAREAVTVAHHPSSEKEKAVPEPWHDSTASNRKI